MPALQTIHYSRVRQPLRVPRFLGLFVLGAVDGRHYEDVEKEILHLSVITEGRSEPAWLYSRRKVFSIYPVRELAMLERILETVFNFENAMQSV